MKKTVGDAPDGQARAYLAGHRPYLLVLGEALAVKGVDLGKGGERTIEQTGGCQGEGVGEGMEWELGISRCRLFYPCLTESLCRMVGRNTTVANQPYFNKVIQKNF